MSAEELRWYHGSPLALTVLRAGSTITHDRHLAEVFSHKPTIVSMDDAGSLQHNGTLPGTLYVVDEPVADGDVLPHPRSSMPPDKEWLTQRPLGLRRIAAVPVSAE